ncbi:hypothetical protein DIPPA_17639 [Diplonema papillatum]|nr:hypothetical protein DIPPA_17639 [Diplonema papillatum]
MLLLRQGAVAVLLVAVLLLGLAAFETGLVHVVRPRADDAGVVATRPNASLKRREHVVVSAAGHQRLPPRLRRTEAAASSLDGPNDREWSQDDQSRVQQLVQWLGHFRSGRATSYREAFSTGLPAVPSVNAPLNVALVTLLADPVDDNAPAKLEHGYLDALAVLAMNAARYHPKGNSTVLLTPVVMMGPRLFAIRELKSLLEQFGWQTMRVTVPVSRDEIQNQAFARALFKVNATAADLQFCDEACRAVHGGVGVWELAKLEAWRFPSRLPKRDQRLGEYSHALVVDVDISIRGSLESVFNEWLPEKATFGFILGAYDSIGSEPVNGGFQVVKLSPASQADYDRLIQIIKDGNWKHGWNGTPMGRNYGGFNQQGLLPYHYMLGDGHGKAALLPRCSLNNMAMRTGCKELDQDRVLSNHFTGDCHKPWQCVDIKKYPVQCQRFHAAWWANIRTTMDAQDGAPEHGCENGAVAAAKEAAALAQACETQIPGDVEQTSAQCTASGGEDFRCERTSRRSSCVAHEVGAGVGGPDAPEGESTRAITSAQVVQDSEGSGVSGAQCRKQLVEPSTGTQENAEVADSPHAAREVPVVDEKWHKSGKEPDTWTQALRNTAAQIEAFEEEEKKTTDPLADAEARNIVMLSLASQDCANHHHLFQHLNKELAEARAVALEAESRKVAAEYRLAANDAALHTYVSSSEHSEVQKMVLTNTEGMRQRIEQLETSLQQTQGEVVLSNALLAESSTRAAVCEGERGSWNACMLAYSFAMKSLAAEAREQVEAKEGQLRETRLLLRKQSDQHVEEAARLHEQRRVADETRAMERKARVAAERCATHTAVEARERVKQIESELHRRGIDYRFTVRDLQDKASRRSVASRVAEDATEAAKHAEEMMRRAFLQEKAKLQAQHSVATHDLQMQLKQATDSLASMQQDLEGHAASRRLAEKQVLLHTHTHGDTLSKRGHDKRVSNTHALREDQQFGENYPLCYPRLLVRVQRGSL